MKAQLANALWLATSLPGWQRFTHAATNVADTQAQYLLRLLHANINTEYGNRYRFASITSPAQYQGLVPLTSYDDYTSLIERIGHGESGLLTAEPVRLFERSSGSTAASKLIPYTDSLRAEFQRGIAPWIFNLYTKYPEVLGGTAYWSVTPLIDGRRFTPAGVPIGFESDSAYLGMLGQWLAKTVMAVSDSVKYLADVDVFRYATLLNLLRRSDLRLISIWSPTFLTLLLEPLAGWWKCLLEDVAYGTFTPPTDQSSSNLRFTPDPGLAHHLAKLASDDYAAIWPQLRLISCWADGPSVPYARQLAERFAHVTIQGKGLLATEGFVSLPLVGLEGGVLAVASHFFEFIDDTGAVWLAHQLEQGKAYEVVITTGGGFYRYRLHDIVEVIGYWKQVPRLRFVGKADHVSDWFGEKLEERFVALALEEVFTAHQLHPIFAMLAPNKRLDGFCYTLYLETDYPPDIAQLAQETDSVLRKNFHYDYCRKLGQLNALQVVLVKQGANSYLRGCELRGQRLGNVKLSVLQKSSGWDTYFLNQDIGT